MNSLTVYVKMLAKSRGLFFNCAFIHVERCVLGFFFFSQWGERNYDSHKANGIKGEEG